jgi:hypothetical protein
MSYENFLIREATGEYQSGDTNCSDCGQVICACESLSEWMDEVNSGEDVCVPASPEIHDDFGSESEPYTYEEAEQRREWLREAYLDQGHLNT